MAKIPGGFVPLDMNYIRDPAIRKAGSDAELLYIRSLAYAKSGQTDGLIHDYDLEVVGVGLKGLHARVTALLRERLWEKVDGGWRIRSWTKWNKTRSDIEIEKRQKSEAGVRANHDRWHKDKSNRECPHCTDGLRLVGGA